ncbi:hypothetical protein CISIN_1g0172991mg, partial [Citrus sinensis]
MFRWKLM